MTISLAQIMKNISTGNPWFATVEQRDGWVERFRSEIEGVRRNLEKDQKSFDAGNEDWHREWAEGHLNYLRKEIRKMERWIDRLMAL